MKSRLATRTTLVRLAVCTLVVLGLAWFSWSATYALGYTDFDDAYMFTRYAKHWLAGEGFSWNAADGPAYGLTSSLHLFIVTIVLGLTHASDAAVLTGVSFTCGVLASVALAALGFLTIAHEWVRRYWIPLLIIPAVLWLPVFDTHSLTGMETTLSLLCNALLACATVALSQRPSGSRIVLCLLSGYATFLARPDNGLYAWLLPPLFLLASTPTARREATRYAVLFLAVVGADLALKIRLFHDAVPLSFFAKQTGYLEGYTGGRYWSAMGGLLWFSRAALPSVLIVIAFAATRDTVRRLAAIAVPFAATFIYYGTLTQIMGLWGRYYYPSVAFVVFGACVVCAASRRPRWTMQSATWRVAAGLIVATVALSGDVQSLAFRAWGKFVIGSPRAFAPKSVYRTAAGEPIQSSWLASEREMLTLMTRMPPGLVMTASEYGQLGSVLPDQTIIDLVGLHDREIARGGFSAAYVLRREPDLIWLPHPHYTYAIAQILDSDAFASEYEYFPGAYEYGLALRRASTQYGRMREILGEDFARLYPGRSLSDYAATRVIDARMR